MTSQINQPLVVNIPINNALVKQAYDLLRNQYIHRNTDEFNITNNTINHSDMDRYIQLLLEEHKSADEEVKNYIRRLKFISEGTQVAKAIVTGKKTRIFVSVFVTSRRRTGTIDEHKILIASMEKRFEVSSQSSSLLSNLFHPIFPFNFIAAILFPISLWKDIFNIAIGGELERILRQLNDEENKKCLEAMAFYALGEKIQSYMGNSVQVRFIGN